MKGTNKVIAGVLGAAALAASPAVFAQVPDKGGYIGGAFGQSKLNDGCSDIRGAFAMFAGSSVSSCDETDTGWKILGGIRVNKNFNVEFSYINWGEISGAGTLVGVPVNVTGEATSFGVAAVGILPINDRFSVFGKAGVLMTELKVSIAGGGTSVSDSDDATELHIGAGVMFNLTGNWQIRAEWERAQDSKLDLISIGVQYRF